MARQLRVLAALAEEPSLFPSTHLVVHSHPQLHLQGPDDPSSDPQRHQLLMQ